MKTFVVASKDNATVKQIRKLLADRNYRYACRRYVLEGVRALDGLPRVETLVVREGTAVPALTAEACAIVAPNVFDALAETEQSQGVMAVCAMPHRAAALDPAKNYLLLDRIQDPGNMGTMIRTACAFGFSGVLLTEGCTDPYAPKAARAAMGALHKIEVRTDMPIESLAGLTLVVADAAGAALPSFVWPRGCVLCVGSEAHGVSGALRAVATHIVAVPIQPAMESLNAAVAAGILAYAVSRNGELA